MIRGKIKRTKDLIKAGLELSGFYMDGDGSFFRGSSKVSVGDVSIEVSQEGISYTMSICDVSVVRVSDHWMEIRGDGINVVVKRMEVV